MAQKSGFKLKTILTILLFFLLTGPLKAQENLPQESENFFNTFLFVDFHNQLKDFVATEMGNEQEMEFIACIENFTPGAAMENRLFYHRMIDQLRLLVKDKHTPFTDHFCLWFFESIEMWDSIVRFQNETFPVQESYPDPMSIDQLFNLTHEIYALTLSNELYNGCHKVSKETNDQMRFGNFPYFLYRLGKTKVIRIPCITKDVGATIQVAEEFDCYLKACKRLKKKLLYVNLITQKYEKPDNGDPKRRKLIESLQLEFEGTLFVATFDKNSPFYFQEGPYETQDDALLFIEQFQTLMFTKSNSMFTIPLHHKTCLELLHQIHKRCFNQKGKLTVSERQDFIHIAYIEMVKLMVLLYDVDTMNISCVNTVDRGISLLSELYLDQIFERGETITREEADRFTSLVLIHPIILRNRPAHEYRLDRIISSTLTLQNSKG